MPSLWGARLWQAPGLPQPRPRSIADQHRRGRTRPGGCDQGLEQARVVIGLRVPLHGQHEGVPAGSGAVYGRGGGFDRFDDAVFGPGGSDQALAELVDGLVVVGGDAEFTVVEYAGQAGTGGDLDTVGAVGAPGRGVAVVADQRREVLVQGAAQSDVQDLEAPADAQQRDTPGQDG